MFFHRQAIVPSPPPSSPSQRPYVFSDFKETLQVDLNEEEASNLRDRLLPVVIGLLRTVSFTLGIFVMSLKTLTFSLAGENCNICILFDMRAYEFELSALTLAEGFGEEE